MADYRPLNSPHENEDEQDHHDEESSPIRSDPLRVNRRSRPPTANRPTAAASANYAQVPLHDDVEGTPEREPPLPGYSQHPSSQRTGPSPAVLPLPGTMPNISSSSSAPSASSTPGRSGDRRAQPAQPRDGVFANLSAKPTLNGADEDKEEEVPPPYETAAADATPPYFDTTVITTGILNDEILVEGLPVGSGFVFVWNMLVSMSFQFVGFLLTYLLHTSHAGKNGSRAGLGITLLQYGFYLRSRAAQDDLYGYYGRESASEETQEDILSRAEWLSYLVMVLGWFIVIRATSEYVRARRMQAIIAYHPESILV